MNRENSSKAQTMALLNRMKTELPEILSKAQVVGTWVWLEFDIPPVPEVRSKLKELGFHWNGKRKCWQHPCRGEQRESSRSQRKKYPALPATDIQLQEASAPGVISSKEYKVISLRECPLPESMRMCDTAEKAVEYWRTTVATNPYFNPECECLTVLILNTRRRVKGHQLISIGTLDTLLVHPREVFRGAVIAAASAVIVMHNHPSGEPQPSEADIRVTRDLIRAGQIMKIDVLDHVIVGNRNHCSLRELGYWAGF